MLSVIESAAHRYRGYAETVITPAIHRNVAPLSVAAYQPREPDPFPDDADYRPVKIGWRWGPPWSTCWFRLRGHVPAECAGEAVSLRFDSGTEALLWVDGVPRQGFDRNRDTCLLMDSASPGAPVECFVEAACHHALGLTTFWWDGPGIQERWQSASPGRLEQAALVVVDETVRRLATVYDIAHRLLLELPVDAPRVHVVETALRRATAFIDDSKVAATAAGALAILEPALGGGAAPSASRCIAVGHAHIDTAWLWTIHNTRRKCLRTFSNVLRLMDRDPDFRFLCSQPQQYAWVEEDAPELFGEITERVHEGRWEPAGAMWIEPDCNVPSGESLVRQILYGVRYLNDRFGDKAPQHILYLPDTFGFTAALPQIMALAGLDTFITNKLSWSQHNVFPYASFRRRGLDGTDVLAHCTPGHDYNAALLPNELVRGERNLARGDEGRTGVWLQPFGYGDGGGGPTIEAIERGQLARDIEGLPVVTPGTAHDFRDALRAAREDLRSRDGDLPVWDGELYLELHRGTLTTQAWLKTANRNAEEALRTAEWLNAAAPSPAPPPEDLTEAWQLLLLNQFHDILPGTSITPVYDDARRQHDRIAQAASSAITAGLDHWSAAVDTRGRAEPMLVFNPHSVPRSGVVSCGASLHHVRNVPALGVAVVDRTAAADIPPVRVTERTLSNGIVEVEIDDAGRLASVRRRHDGREAGRLCDESMHLPLNQLVLYEDRPRSWEAWDIDAEYTDRAMPVDTPVTSRVIAEQHPLRGAIEVTRLLGDHSAITQRYVLDAGSPRIDIQTHVRWQESKRLLRALFPVDVRARRATYEIQFGHLERPTHANTTWEQAAFEVCGHTWMDLSEPGFGVALLNDCKYGHSCRDGVMGLSLLRAPSFPDPTADRGEHRFSYSVMLHDGDWRRSQVDREAHALGTPLLTRTLPAGQTGEISDAWAPFSLTTSGAAGVVVSACKRSEDGDRLIVRLVETHGGAGTLHVDWRLPVRAVASVDLLEHPRDEGIEHHEERTTVQIRPFQIVTLAARCGP